MQGQFDFNASERLKLEGIRKVSNKKERQHFISITIDIAKELLHTHGYITSDMLAEQLEELNIRIPHPNLMGAVMRKLAISGLVFDSGQYVKTQRKSGHARKITKWIAL